MPELRASAVFLKKVNQEWKISPIEYDAKILPYLITQASPFVHYADPNVYSSPAQFRKANEEQEASRQAATIKFMQDSGATVAQINGVKESFALMKDGTLATNWLAWKTHYNFQELNPPITYDVHLPWGADFSNPLSAQHSYRHAIYAGDGKTLYQYADETGKNDLKRLVGDENVKRDTYEISPKITRYTVLFTATTKFEHHDYVMVFFRAQEGVDPKDGIVTFQSDIFKKTPNGYVYTADLDASFTFGNPGAAAHVGPMFMPKYSRFYQIASKSEFPEYYYKIDE
jgi:hypothetical protein